MSRSALGRGLGSLLAENGTRGVPVPGPGVGRLMQPAVGSPAVPAPAPRAAAIPATPAAVPMSARRESDGRMRGDFAGIRPALWLADAALVGIGFWLGAFSPLAGQAIALVAAGLLLAIGALLGVLAAS